MHSSVYTVVRCDVIFYTAVRSLTTNILQALQDSSFSGKAVELDSFEQTYDLKQ